MLKVLIVEDERPIADLVELNLSACGYGCTCCYDGLTAADLLEQNVFDLVLLDVMLPGLSGYDLLEQIRPLGIPVIFLTALDSTADRVRGLRAGADAPGGVRGGGGARDPVPDFAGGAHGLRDRRVSGLRVQAAPGGRRSVFRARLQGRSRVRLSDCGMGGLTSGGYESENCRGGI